MYGMQMIAMMLPMIMLLAGLGMLVLECGLALLIGVMLWRAKG